MLWPSSLHEWWTTPSFRLLRQCIQLPQASSISSGLTYIIRIWYSFITSPVQIAIIRPVIWLVRSWIWFRPMIWMCHRPCIICFIHLIVIDSPLFFLCVCQFTKPHFCIPLLCPESSDRRWQPVHYGQLNFRLAYKAEWSCTPLQPCENPHQRNPWVSTFRLESVFWSDTDSLSDALRA